jgi:hypothetical protein
VKPSRRCYAAARYRIAVVHTREGHLPDLSDAPPAKIARGAPSSSIGDSRPDGADPDPRRSRPTTSFPRCIRWTARSSSTSHGKGAFYATELDHVLRKYGNRESAGVRRDHRSLRQHTRCARPMIAAIAAWCFQMAAPSYFPEFHEMGLT